MSKDELKDYLISLLNQCLSMVDEKEELTRVTVDKFFFPEGQRLEKFTRPIIGLFNPMVLFRRRKYREKDREKYVEEQTNMYMSRFYDFRSICISTLDDIKNGKLTNDEIVLSIKKYSEIKNQLFKPSISDRRAAHYLGRNEVFGQKAYTIKKGKNDSTEIYTF